MTVTLFDRYALFQSIPAITKGWTRTLRFVPREGLWFYFPSELRLEVESLLGGVVQ
jgi:hypothetical protein